MSDSDKGFTMPMGGLVLLCPQDGWTCFYQLNGLRQCRLGHIECLCLQSLKAYDKGDSSLVHCTYWSSILWLMLSIAALYGSTVIEGRVSEEDFFAHCINKAIHVATPFCERALRWMLSLWQPARRDFPEDYHGPVEPPQSVLPGSDSTPFCSQDLKGAFAREK